MGQESEVLSVTDATATATFSSTVYYVEIFNAGANTAFVAFGEAATTNKFPVLSGETLKLYASIDDVRAITAASTTTLQIIGTR